LGPELTLPTKHWANHQSHPPFKTAFFSSLRQESGSIWGVSLTFFLNFRKGLLWLLNFPNLLGRVLPFFFGPNSFFLQAKFRAFFCFFAGFLGPQFGLSFSGPGRVFPVTWVFKGDSPFQGAGFFQPLGYLSS